MIVNAEVDTLIESNLGTMIINDTDDDDNDDVTAEDNSETMKRWFSFIVCYYLLCCDFSLKSPSLIPLTEHI